MMISQVQMKENMLDLRRRLCIIVTTAKSSRCEFPVMGWIKVGVLRSL